MNPIDLLYVACNRLEFTRESFTTLLANTDWRLVRQLSVWDDGSTDGTREWLQQAISQVPGETSLIDTRLGSPVSVMCQFAQRPGTPSFAKIDNDTMVPPGWLGDCVGVLEAHSALQLLGIEALQPVGATGPRTFVPAPCVSGLGLYRRAIFESSQPAVRGQWFGFEEWQRENRLGCGWISPALPIFLLDRMPFEPWSSLTRSYVARRWQRPWQAYAPDSALWHWRWPPMARPPGLRLNLGCFDNILPGFVNIDHQAGPGVDQVVDLRLPWPWADGSVDEVRAWNVVQQLPDKRFTMNELWRVLRPHARAEICVPTTDGTSAFADPANLSFWNRRSFLYFEAGNPYRERFADLYGIRARFRAVEEASCATPEGTELRIAIEAVK